MKRGHRGHFVGIRPIDAAGMHAKHRRSKAFAALRWCRAENHRSPAPAKGQARVPSRGLDGPKHRPKCYLGFSVRGGPIPCLHAVALAL